MQNQRLTNEQRAIKRWRDKRAKLVYRLLTDNPRMTSAEALRLANKKAGPMPGKRR